MHVIRSSHLDSVSVNVRAFLNLSLCGNLGLGGGRCRDINLCGNYEAIGNKRHMEDRSNVRVLLLVFLGLTNFHGQCRLFWVRIAGGGVFWRYCRCRVNPVTGELTGKWVSLV